MANTFTIDQSHRISPKTANVGLFKMSIASTDTYATASGGITIDLTAPLLQLGISALDIRAIIGNTTTGYTVLATPVAGGNTFTVRLRNALTEITDGAITQTLNVLVFYSAGSTT